MECPNCSVANPAGADVCTDCGAPLDETEAPTSVLPTTPPAPQPPRAGVDSWKTPTDRPHTPTAGTLTRGLVVGGRYEILDSLGEGGMGAVYKAKDLELDRIVAMKTIRPELAGNTEVLQRFKQELILAREVTHRNVIRIFDLGQSEGLKFITMEYVEGKDLDSLIHDKGKLAPEEAAEIVQQVCHALEAAHLEGVVHRDLKPPNIMIDPEGRVKVMDFGIARSLESTGMTQTGSVIGTPDYMSPEQVKGEPVDGRSDLFSLGVIFYQLLTGTLPFLDASPMATMYKRTHERAAPAATVNPLVPGFLSDMVGRCLEITPQRRYQSAREILHDLEAWRGGTPPRTAVTTAEWLRHAPVSRKWVAMVAVLVVVGAASAYLWWRAGPDDRTGPGVAPPAVGTALAEVTSLAILPFRNGSGDASLDWLGPGLAEMLRTDIGQSASLRTVSSDRLHQILRDLRIAPGNEIDPATLRRIAEFSNADNIIWGQYLKIGEQIRIDATIEDLKGQRSVPLKAEAARESELLPAVETLAAAVQNNLAMTDEQVQQLRTAAFTPSSESVTALRFFSEGLALVRQGNNVEAAEQFKAAVQEDPGFALAHSKLGQTYAQLGYRRQAEDASRKAVDLSASASPPERSWILAESALVQNDFEQGLDSYRSLAAVTPEDPEINFRLAELYEATGSFEQARDHYARAVNADPKNVSALLAGGRVEIKSGRPEASLDHLNRALSLAVQFENPQGRANILQAMGIAYRLLDRPEEALRNYQESLEIKRRIDDKRGMAASMTEIALIQEVIGHPDKAMEYYDGALRIQDEIGDSGGMGSTLINMGDLARAQGRHDDSLKRTKQALQILTDLGDEQNQSQALNNIGTTYFLIGQYDDAQIYYQRSLDLRRKLQVPGDMADTLHNLAETSERMGRYDKALDHYLGAMEQRRTIGDQTGIALESYGMGTLFQYQGRYGAALSSIEEALQILRQIENRGSFYVEFLAGHGNVLNLMGRGGEAETILEEARGLARDLGIDPLVAMTTNFLGDRHFYRGNLDAAASAYEQALGIATDAGDSHQLLISRFNQGKNAVRSGDAAAAVAILSQAGEEAESMGLKYLSTECAVYLGEAQLGTGEHGPARRTLDDALRRSENLGSRLLVAKSHLLLARALEDSEPRQAAEHVERATEILEEMSQEAQSDALLERADLKPSNT